MPRNLAESTLNKIRKIAHERGEDVTSTLTRYALERLLFRLAQTHWKDKIALKGSLIFVAHDGDTHRPTADIDINGYEAGDISSLEEMIRQAISVDIEDAVDFDVSTIKIRKERDSGFVPGGKVELSARIHSAQVRVRVDAGFGNAVNPAASWMNYPSLLETMPQPLIQVYPYETMFSEKLHAMAKHGIASTRMRDYYDLYVVSQKHNFSGLQLSQAVLGTFNAHQDLLPDGNLDGLSAGYVEKWHQQWETFHKGKGFKEVTPDLEGVVERLRNFISPVLNSIHTPNADPGDWQAGTGWSSLEPYTPGARF